MWQSVLSECWFQSTDYDVIDLLPDGNNHDVEGVIYTRICSQSNTEILFK
jgi:hypothetical protein